MISSLRKIVVLGLVWGAAGGILPAQGYRTADAKVDYTAARREIQDFEAILDGVASKSLNGAASFALQNCKGAYLPGYGMVFSFVANVHRALINTPFGPKKNDLITPEDKKKRIDELKEQLIMTIFLRGDSLRQIGRDELVSIVARIEDRNFPDEENQSKTVILTVSRRDLEELVRKEDRIKEFKQRVKIVEY
jgi:hypothetical protein